MTEEASPLGASLLFSTVKSSLTCRQVSTHLNQASIGKFLLLLVFLILKLFPTSRLVWNRIRKKLATGTTIRAPLTCAIPMANQSIAPALNHLASACGCVPTAPCLMTQF